MSDIIIWLIIGAVAGAIASAIVPGRTPGGMVGAIIAGIVGGLLGGWILDALDVNENLTWIGSLVVAIIGAIIILMVMRKTDVGTGDDGSVTASRL
jgi:uncharacterized membrane protein YeaQ/YmgE (transglycosylase-associated protein family)